jgi:hypothetical protein
MSDHLPALVISAVDCAIEIFDWKPSPPIPVMKPGKVRLFDGDEIDGLIPTGETQENGTMFYYAAKLRSEHQQAFALWKPSIGASTSPVEVGWIVGRTPIDAAMKWIGELVEIVASVIDHEVREDRQLRQAEWHQAIREAADEWHGFNPTASDLRKLRMSIRAMIPTAISEDDLLRKACSDWNNNNATWREITLMVDGQIFNEDDQQGQIDACTNRVKRFANQNEIRLRKSKAGRKPRKNSGI